jgi:hypothetical protein
MPEGEVEEVAEFLMRMHFEGLITIKNLDVYDHEADFAYKDEVFHIDLVEWSKYPTYEEFKAKLVEWLEGEYSRILEGRRKREENERVSEKLSIWLVDELEKRGFKVEAYNSYPDEDGITIELRVVPS